MKSAFGLEAEVASAPTRSVLQSPPRTNVWTRPLVALGDPADGSRSGRGRCSSRYGGSWLSVRGGDHVEVDPEQASSSVRTPAPSRCLSLDDGAAAAGRGAMDGLQERHVAERRSAKSVRVTGRSPRIAPTKSISAVQPARSSSRITTGSPGAATGRRARSAAPPRSTDEAARRAVEGDRGPSRRAFVRADISTWRSRRPGTRRGPGRGPGRRPRWGRPVRGARPGRGRVTRGDRLGWPEPARHRLGQDAEGHDVLAAVAALPAPEVAGVARPARVPARPGRDAPGRSRRRASSRTIVASAQSENDGRHDHRDEVGVRTSGREHRPGVLGGGGHPRLGQDVLAGLERGDRHRRVEDRPGADEDRIDVRVGDERAASRG